MQRGGYDMRQNFVREEENYLQGSLWNSYGFAPKIDTSDSNYVKRVKRDWKNPLSQRFPVHLTPGPRINRQPYDKFQTQRNFISPQLVMHHSNPPQQPMQYNSSLISNPLLHSNKNLRNPLTSMMSANSDSQSTLQFKENEPASIPSDRFGTYSSPSKKTNYFKELEAQVNEKKKREQLDKLMQKQLENHDNSYHPFGKRGGGGDPIKDRNGNIITSRAPYAMKHDPHNDYSPQKNQLRKHSDNLEGYKMYSQIQRESPSPSNHAHPQRFESPTMYKGKQDPNYTENISPHQPSHFWGKQTNEQINEDVPDPSLFVTKTIDIKREQKRRQMAEDLKNELNQQIEKKKKIKEQEKQRQDAEDRREEERLQKERNELHTTYQKEIGSYISPEEKQKQQEEKQRAFEREREKEKDREQANKPRRSIKREEQVESNNNYISKEEYEEFQKFNKYMKGKKVSVNRRTTYDAALDQELESLKREMQLQEQQFSKELFKLKDKARSTTQKNYGAQRQLKQLKEELTRHNTLSGDMLEQMAIPQKKSLTSINSKAQLDISTEDPEVEEHNKALQNYGKMFFTEYKPQTHSNTLTQKQSQNNLRKFKDYHLSGESQLLSFHQTAPLSKSTKSIHPVKVHSKTKPTNDSKFNVPKPIIRPPPRHDHLLQEFDTEMDKLDELMLNFLENDQKASKVVFPVYSTEQSFGTSDIKADAIKRNSALNQSVSRAEPRKSAVSKQRQSQNSEEESRNDGESNEDDDDQSQDTVLEQHHDPTQSQTQQDDDDEEDDDDEQDDEEDEDEDQEEDDDDDDDVQKK